MNIKIEIEYEGTDYVGWQKQASGKSIQGELEACLQIIFKKKISIYVAGRTDAGVHALGQVAHFEVENCKINPAKIYQAINAHLYKSKNKIIVKSSSRKDESFHARFSAKNRIYEYKIFNKKVQSPFINQRMWFVPQKLDLLSMKKASEYLIDVFENYSNYLDNAVEQRKFVATNFSKAAVKKLYSNPSEIPTEAIKSRLFERLKFWLSPKIVEFTLGLVAQNP